VPVDFTPNCGSQLERAVRAFHIASGARPAGGIFVTNDPNERTNPLRTITAQASNASETELSGNETWQVQIVDQFDSNVQQNQKNADANRLAMDTQVGLMMKCMMQSSNGSNLDVTVAGITEAGRALATTGTAMEQRNNQDMLEFTCLFVRFLGSGRGHPSEEGNAKNTFWVEERRFEIKCCPSNVD
jgi:hypothetical protein